MDFEIDDKLGSGLADLYTRLRDELHDIEVSVRRAFGLPSQIIIQDA